MQRWRWLALAISLCLNSTATFAEATQPTETFTLKSGLQVIVLPNHRVPAVNHMLWYRIGAADDPDGKSGLAHYHEHLMFKGSPKFKAGEYTRLLDVNGGNHNAFTGRDATSYYVTIAKEKLPLVMGLEADRMRALTVSDEEAKTEKQVILEERRQRIDNSPDALLDEQLNATLFRNHPYERPVIGWFHEMEGLSKKDAIDFHARYYHPNNAVLIVSGDITAAELKPFAEQYYGDLPRREVPARVWKKEPPYNASFTVTLTHPNVAQPVLKRVYTTIPSDAAHLQDAAAIMVMSHILGGGKNSLLYQSLVVDKKLATSVDVDYSFFSRGPASLTVEIVPEAGVALSNIEKELDVMLATFIAGDPAEESLVRSKNVMKADAIYAREGLTSISNVMGWIVINDLPISTFNDWPRLIDNVTLDAVKKNAVAIFVPTQSVTGYLLPEYKKP